MSRFSWMVGKNKSWATAQATSDFDDYALWDLIEALNDKSQWKTIRLTLGEGNLADFPPCNVIGRLCSPAMVEILNPYASKVLWLPVVLSRNNESYDYFFMHFSDCTDVLDKDKSIFLDGDVVSPHISLQKANELPLICLRKLSPSVIVRDDVRDALEKNGITGIGFEDIPSS